MYTRPYYNQNYGQSPEPCEVDERGYPYKIAGLKTLNLEGEKIETPVANIRIGNDNYEISVIPAKVMSEQSEIFGVKQNIKVVKLPKPERGQTF